MSTFDEFLTGFFDLYAKPQFRGGDFRQYLQRPAPGRMGDEASVVDTAIVGPLLSLLGFAPGEQVYNQNNRNGRADFAPRVAEVGDCFVVEDKSTGRELTFDLADPDSSLSQLSAYLRDRGLRAGWLTNGRRLTVWQFDDPARPVCALDFDVPAALDEWARGGIDALSPGTKQALGLLWERFRRETFADWQRIERELAMEDDVWLKQALPLGGHAANQETLVGAVRTLLQDLQSEARGLLEGHLGRYADYESRSERLRDDAPERARAALNDLRTRALELLNRLAPLIGLDSGEFDGLHTDLRELERDPRAFLNTKDLQAKALGVINAARARKFAGDKDKKASKPWAKWDNGLAELGEALEQYGETAFAWHQRQATLRQSFRGAIEVHDNYTLWTSLVQETMLGGMDEDQRRNEFALQAAYVVFIRLLLLRVCEDKGIFPHRFISDGGLREWQKDIERYFVFATGNPYDTLLDMAYQNAQNIYAHFFTGRELFNWYSLDRLRFIRVLHQLSRFNFAEVDSDLIGTVYNTYVERKEKKQKGQYYTPPAIVRYILDEAGYKAGPGIIGANKRLIDPACGSGTFLVEAARRLVAAYSASGAVNPRLLLDRVRDSLYGFDLNPFACYLAEVNLLIQVLDLVKVAIEGRNPPRLQRFHVYNVDALAPGGSILRYARANTLMAEELDVVDRIKGRHDEYASGFAWVVANPPYGAKLTDAYKAGLREWYGDVFSGQPDTYVFFMRLGLNLLGQGGRLGFITPHTYLMGTNTQALRQSLLQSGRITQIVDLPQGIWEDASVNCVLLFLTADADATRRQTQQTQVYSMDVHDSLDKLTQREWQEALTQSQSVWMDDPKHEINTRWSPLLQHIENACRVTLSAGSLTKVLRLSDITESSAGIDPYATSAAGAVNSYIKPHLQLPQNEPEWKPLLDGSAYVGRYELRWGPARLYIKYGNWLCRPRENRFFDSPKLITQQIRGRELKRRLVATYDDTKYYHRKNFNNIIASNSAYDLKYILALFNSSLLNYWYARQYDNLNINPSYFRQLPVYPADAATQAELVTLVDGLLAEHAALNLLREQDYVIRARRDATRDIQVPYDMLLRDLQTRDQNFPVVSLFDARAMNLLRLPPACDQTAQIGRVFTPAKYPETVTLRANQLWVEVDDADTRRYLRGYLARPQWQGRTWDEISDRALVPADADALRRLFALEAQVIADITARLDTIAALDTALDLRVLDLYGIYDPADRARILGSAPAEEDADPDTPADPDAETSPDTEAAAAAETEAEAEV